MKIRYTELFYSIQGEGMYVGVPSVFLRLFGCNLTCQGFAGTPSNSVDPSSIKRVEELNGADFSVGCDSRYSWHPDYKHLALNEDVEHVAELILELVRDTSQTDVHLVITGGEPLMQQKAIVELVSKLNPYFDQTIRELVLTIETNGTIPLDASFRTSLQDSVDVLLYSISPKLSHSGDPYSKRMNLKAIDSINKNLYGYDNVQLKFVVSTEFHIKEVQQLLSDEYHLLSYNPVYLMPLGGSLIDYQKSAPNVAQLALKYGFRYSPRLHIDLFGNSVGT